MTDRRVHLADVLQVALMSSGRLNDRFCTAMHHDGVEFIYLSVDVVVAVEGKLHEHVAH